VTEWRSSGKTAPGFLVLALLILSAGCGPPGPQALLKGRELVERGKYQEAIQQLKVATSLLPTNALAWDYLGLAYHHAGDGTEAEKAYQRALLCNRDLVEVHYNLGCLWLEQNKTNGARNELTAFVLHRPNSVEGLLKLGAAQLRCRELAAAEKTFNEALRRSPQNPEALNALGILRFQQRRVVDASQQFENALRAQPGYPAALLNLAIVSHSSSKDRPLALQKYREYLALKPTPDNSESVRQIARQLEAELATPARVVPSNTSPAVLPATNNPGTNHRSAAVATPASAIPPVTNPAPARSPGITPSLAAQSTPTNPPKPVPAPATNTAKPVAAPSTPVDTPVEVVKLPPDPVLMPAEDISPPPKRAEESPPPTAALASGPRPQTPDSKSKRSLVQRINPLNLFRSEPKPTTTRTTPLPPPNTSAPPQEVAMASASSPPESASTDPSPRYNYRSPSRPTPGNHVEAERSFAQGLQAQQKQHLPEAIQAYNIATIVDPAYFEAHYNLGLAAAASGDLSAALGAYENALAIKPESLDARYNFALVLKQANYPLDAVHELEKLLTGYPNEARAHLFLANLYAHQLRQPATARPHYLKVLELDPKNPQSGVIRNWLSTNPQ
jgi:tetratricopeptide (TPR) repeat protein